MDDAPELGPNDPYRGQDKEPGTAPNADAEHIGYGNPPQASRFKPGQSGNPRGRPKGARGLRAELKAELDERVTVTVDGKQSRIPKRRVIIKMLAAKAAKGDVRAADKLLALVIQAEGFEDERPQSKTLSANDRLIVERFFPDGDEPVVPDMNQNQDRVQDLDADAVPETDTVPTQSTSPTPAPSADDDDT